MWSSPFAQRNGAGVVEILDKTGFRTYSEFVDETTPLERRLLVKSIEAYHDKRDGGGTGGLGGL
jgi:hypothetical protein